VIIHETNPRNETTVNFFFVKCKKCLSWMFNWFEGVLGFSSPLSPCYGYARKHKKPKQVKNKRGAEEKQMKATCVLPRGSQTK
jgi:hypothetical protein